MRIGYSYGAAAALIGLQIGYFYGRLPAVIASHFDGRGFANGYMSRSEFIDFYIGIVAFVMVVFGATALLIRSIPTQLINVPNRDYWFGDERQAASRAWLCREILCFGLVTIFFLAIVMQGVFIANTEGVRPSLSTSYVLSCMGVLVGGILVLGVRLFRRFS